MAQHLIRAIILGGQLVSRAFAKALKNEFQAGRQASAGAQSSSSSQESVQTTRLTGISIEEAKQILNIKDLDEKLVEERFKHLFEVNDKSKGGSFYLQSKVYRAKERIDEELKLQNVKKADVKKDA